MNNELIRATAKELAGILTQIAELQEDAKTIIGNAKDSGMNVKALRKIAREMVMESDKREKLYADEDQLHLFRDAVGLTAASYREAAE